MHWEDLNEMAREHAQYWLDQQCENDMGLNLYYKARAIVEYDRTLNLTGSLQGLAITYSKIQPMEAA